MDIKGNKIREQRKSLTYSISELASITNVPEKDIIAYETNKKTAKLRTIEKIANATGTNVNDWVDEDYFVLHRDYCVKKKGAFVNQNDTEEITINDDNVGVLFFQALFRADDVADIMYTALIDMNEIKMVDEQVEFSEFAKEILSNIGSIKLKKVMGVCKPDKNKVRVSNNASESIGAKDDNCDIRKREKSVTDITFNNLLQEAKIIFKNTDSIEIVMQALININHVDIKGQLSEKANILLDTIMSNKLKSLMCKK